MKYADARELVFAYTESGGTYPSYVNVSVDGHHQVHLSVRGARREDGSEGSGATIRLSMTTFMDLVRQVNEQLVEAGFSAARSCDLANNRSTPSESGA